MLDADSQYQWDGVRFCLFCCASASILLSACAQCVRRAVRKQRGLLNRFRAPRQVAKKLIQIRCSQAFAAFQSQAHRSRTKGDKWAQPSTKDAPGGDDQAGEGAATPLGIIEHVRS